MARIASFGCSLLAFAAAADAQPAAAPQVVLAGGQGSQLAFRAKEPLQVHLRVGTAAHAYCFYADCDGRVSRVFPNRFQPDALIPAGRAIMIPGIIAGFQIVPEKPGTREEIRCFAAERDLAAAVPDALISIDLTPLPVGSLLDVADAFRRVDSSMVEVALSIWVVGEARNGTRLSSQRERNVLLVRPEAKAILAAITKQESGGNYLAVGPPTKYGRAYGRYQVLDRNIPKWTRRALGYPLTPKEFLSDPKAQDLTAGYVMTAELRRLNYSIRDMIAVWFTGDPYDGNNECDPNMCVKQYVRLAEAELARMFDLNLLRKESRQPAPFRPRAPQKPFAR